jgi:hypothetical protein
MTTDHFEGEHEEPAEAGGVGTAMPGSGTADEQGTRATGASGVDTFDGESTYSDVDSDTSGSLDGTPDENT